MQEQQLPDGLRFSGDVQRLTLKPGDTVVVTSDRVLDMQEHEILSRWLKNAFEGHQVVVLELGLSLKVVECPAP